MNRIIIADTTLCREEGTFSFKDKMEIARQLERLKVDIIELPAIARVHADTLLVRTMASFVKNATVSVAAGQTVESIDLAAAALEGMAHPRIRIELPMSAVGMEYTCHKKPAKMLEWVTAAVTAACQKGCEVEFCAVDATRADEAYLRQAIAAAVAAGAACVAVCDSAGTRLPDDFAAFIAGLKEEISVPLAVRCEDVNGLACAQAVLAVRQGAACVKTSIGGTAVPLEMFASMVKNCGEAYGFETGIRTTELHRIARQIAWITDQAKDEKSVVTVADGEEESVRLDAKDDQAAVMTAVARLGYDLSEEDQARVYEEFCRVAEKKTVGAKELEAIVATTALQVPAAYRLVSYVMNNGNIISASAQITLKKDDKELQGVCIGDGPIDAAFLAIDRIIGHHYELDDFQIQSVTQGKEAVGSALVKLRAGGKLYSGNGISTDIMEASILAYINAVNKIVYEEG
ncbi:MAG: hypothetical protein IIW40_05465 [Clostridia bacterium]|nr:hypothetical protein [Clostridia bacterium]